MKNFNKYLLIALFMYAVCGCNIVINKYNAEGIGPSAMNFLYSFRYIISGFYLIYLEKRPSNIKSAKLVQKLSIPMILKILLLGFLQVQCFQYFNAKALPLVDTSFASIMEQTQALIIIILGVLFFHKQPNKKDYKAIGFYLLGVTVLLLGNGLLHQSLLGMLYLLIAVTAMAFSDYLVLHILDKYDILAYFIKGLTNIFGGVFLFIIQFDLNAFNIPPIHYILILITIFTLILTHTLWAYCIERLEVYVLYTARIAQVAVSGILGIFVFHELPSFPTVLSCIIVFYALFLLGRSKQEQVEETN